MYAGIVFNIGNSCLNVTERTPLFAFPSGGRLMGEANVIHVALAVYDPTGAYARHTGVVMASMFERATAPVRVHILHDDTLTGGNRALLLETASLFGQEAEFHDASETLGQLGDFAVQSARESSVSVGAIFRLLIPDLLPVDKVIYLDSDVVVNLDIRELWDISVEGLSIAGVGDESFGTFSSAKLAMRLVGCDPKQYANSGVLVMNLSRIRERHDLPKECAMWFKRYGHCSTMLDQDFINYIFRGDITLIDRKFNSGRRDGDVSGTIMHATGGSKPWNSLEGSAMERLYWKAYLKTAWARHSGQDEIVDKMLDAVKNSIWTHRHTTSCYRSILKRFRNDIVLNGAIRTVSLLAKYLRGKAKNLAAG
jgi:lipopolysaccharide biosynthesis glycosyltransferase